MTIHTFKLVRDVDESGVSGTGTVAEGVRFSDGTAALRWLTERRSTAVYRSMEDLRSIHGHGGKTRVAYDDETEADPFMRGRLHCAMDAMENAPFSSVGGPEQRPWFGMRVPIYIEGLGEEYRSAYLDGYADEAHARYGDDWRVCEFAWHAVLTIPGP